MADYLIKESTLANIADAIRSKTGDSDELNPLDMPEAIESIETGITPTGNIQLAQQSGTDVTNYATASVRGASVALNTPTVNSSGLVTASASVSTTGWIGSAPANKTLQLTTQAGKTVTPSESSQTAVASGRYTTGAVTVAAVPSETKTVALDMSSGDQSIARTSGKWMTSVTVQKPATMLPENIKKDVNIGGVVGTMEAGEGLPELPKPSEWSGTSFTLDKDYQISEIDPELDWDGWELPSGYTLTIPAGKTLYIQESANEFDANGTLVINGTLKAYALIYCYVEVTVNGVLYAHSDIENAQIGGTGSVSIHANGSPWRSIECGFVEILGSSHNAGGITAEELGIYGSLFGDSISVGRLYMNTACLNFYSIEINSLIAPDHSFIDLQYDYTLTFDDNVEIQSDEPFVRKFSEDATIIGVPEEYIIDYTGGSAPYWDGTIEIPMPNKGDIITMNLDGTDKDYLVLKTNDSVAEVLARESVNDEIAFNSDGENIYDNTDLDTYLSTTYYNTLSTNAKAAIVDKNINQYQYSYDNSVYNADTHASYANYSTKSVKATVGYRHIYAIGVEDVEEYFNNEFGTSDIQEMFNTTEEGVWLSSAYAGHTLKVWHVPGNFGYLDNDFAYNNNAARPAFQIDLSKISWSAVNTGA